MLQRTGTAGIGRVTTFKALAFTSILIALLALTISGALLIGRAQPIPERVAVLHLGDICALPCWIGITPGKTTLSEAQGFIEKIYGTENSVSIGRTFNSTRSYTITMKSKKTLSIELSADFGQTDADTLIENVRMVETNEIIRMGDIVNLFDGSSFITVEDINSNSCKISSNQLVYIRYNCIILDNGSVQRTSMIQDVWSINIDLYGNLPGIYTPWQGFGLYHTGN